MPDHEGSVLIVEDDESLRTIVARHLRGQGFEVGEAQSAEEAARELERGLRPDAVLLDVNLPGDTGWDLLRGPSLRNAAAPAIVITSAGSVSPRLLREFGCSGWLPKPFPLETLVDTLDRVIGARKASVEP